MIGKFAATSMGGRFVFRKPTYALTIMNDRNGSTSDLDRLDGSFRPESVIHWGHVAGPLLDQKEDIRANCCGAEQSLHRLCLLWDLYEDIVGADLVA
jgi:hypothetical protein